MIYSLSWLTDKFESGEKLKYLFFWGHTKKATDTNGKFVFSQWYSAPFKVDDVIYKTAEHWMMAQKAKLFNDEDAFEKIIQADKPGEVKELGRQINRFNQDVWDCHKYEIVREGNFHKFSQHKELKDFLLQTKDRVIVEASPVDTIWGIGLAEDSPLIENPNFWKGQNLLGFALMEVRDILKR